MFRYTVSIAKHFDLIGGKPVARDSTKLRAQNAKKNNFNEAKIERHLAYIDAKLDEYNKVLSEADDENKQIIVAEIKKQEERKKGYENKREQLEKNDEAQISTSDPDSRRIMIRNNISEVAYNIQTVVDAKNNLPIDYKVTNENDSRALGSMLRRTKTILGTSHSTALYDKAYHTGIKIKKALEMGVEVMVAVPAAGAGAPDENYNVSCFIYNEKNDTYICPQQQVLTTNGNWYKKSRETNQYTVKHYKTHACTQCAAKQCAHRQQKAG